MAKFFYSPFYTDDYQTANTEIVNSRASSLAKGAQEIQRIVPGTFAGMQPNDDLIIGGHGSFENDSLYETSDPNVGGSMPCTTVAQWLEYGDLPTSHVRIRVRACTSLAFARRLAMLLGGVGVAERSLKKVYPKIAVGGYFFEVVTIGTTNRTFVKNPGYRLGPMAGRFNVRNSGEVTWFNGGGMPIATKPRPEVEATQHYFLPPPPITNDYDQPSFDVMWIEGMDED